MSDLILNLKAEYFDAIEDGSKEEEYRLQTPYWKKRIERRSYRNVVICKGYPRKDDMSRRLVFPWTGYRTTKLTHPHFGPSEVMVYAIFLNMNPTF